eukprot:4788528-Prymnesium_polylepis.1
MVKCRNRPVKTAAPPGPLLSTPATRTQTARTPHSVDILATGSLTQHRGHSVGAPACSRMRMCMQPQGTVPIPRSSGVTQHNVSVQ